MANAVKNAKYQSSNKQNSAQKEVQAAVKAVAGQAFEPLAKKLAALEVKYKQLEKEND